MTGYSLPFEKFRFVPNFASVGNYISNKKVVWDFGDGTTSTDLTAFHSYNYSGNYPITLTVFNSSGDSTQSSYTSAVQISNFINDAIIITSNGTPTQVSGQINNPFYLTRYNSYQTTITGRNSVINLSVSGNKSPFYTADKFYKDKNTHFYPTARFAVLTDHGYTVVDEVSTTNTFIYASPAGSSITLSLTSGDNSYIAGTSGYASFFYI